MKKQKFCLDFFRNCFLDAKSSFIDTEYIKTNNKHDWGTFAVSWFVILIFFINNPTSRKQNSKWLILTFLFLSFEIQKPNFIWKHLRFLSTCRWTHCSHRSELEKPKSVFVRLEVERKLSFDIEKQAISI